MEREERRGWWTLCAARARDGGGCAGGGELAARRCLRAVDCVQKADGPSEDEVSHITTHFITWHASLLTEGTHSLTSAMSDFFTKKYNEFAAGRPQHEAPARTANKMHIAQSIVTMLAIFSGIYAIYHFHGKVPFLQTAVSSTKSIVWLV